MATFTTYDDPVDMTQLGILNDFESAAFGRENATRFTYSANGETYRFTGTDFTYDSNGNPTGGTITHIRVIDQNGDTDNYQIGKLDLSVQQFETFAQTNDLSGFENAIFGGNDHFNVGTDINNTPSDAGHIEGFGGNDRFVFNPVSNNYDICDGGAGYNTVEFKDGFSYDIEPGTLQNIQKIVLEPGTYSIDMQNFTSTDPDNISGGKPLTIDGHLLSASEPLTFNANDQAVLVNLIGGAGNDTLLGGSGDNTFCGGLGQDMLSGSDTGGHTTFIYHSAAESTGINFDLLNFFDPNLDKFQVPHAVIGIDPAVTTGVLDWTNFDTDLNAALKGHLDPHNAVLFTADSGDGAGETFLVIDQNGVPGYQSGHDIVVNILPDAQHLSNLSMANFIVHP